MKKLFIVLFALVSLSVQAERFYLEANELYIHNTEEHIELKTPIFIILDLDEYTCEIFTEKKQKYIFEEPYEKKEDFEKAIFWTYAIDEGLAKCKMGIQLSKNEEINLIFIYNNISYKYFCVFQDADY